MPVGEDQQQHIELARDVAKRFNDQFGGNKWKKRGGRGGRIFKLPDIMTPPTGARVMSLTDGTSKVRRASDEGFTDRPHDREAQHDQQRSTRWTYTLANQWTPLHMSSNSSSTEAAEIPVTCVSRVLDACSMHCLCCPITAVSISLWTCLLTAPGCCP